MLPGVVVPLGRGDVELTDARRVRERLAAERPDVVVNCAAYNFVDPAESDPGAAFAVNAWAVRDLAVACRDLDCTLVHFSTDYVFGLDEARQTPFSESDVPGPVSVYGLSKLAGEYLVRAICPKHLVIRTCGLYGLWGSGGKGGNFVETMLSLAAQGKPVRVVHDQRCTPSFAADIAAATAALIATGVRGLYHITNAGDCTWYEFAREIFRAAGVEVSLTPITSAESGRPARRPAYSVLSNVKLDMAGVDVPRPWSNALRAYLNERTKRPGSGSRP